MRAKTLWTILMLAAVALAGAQTSPDANEQARFLGGLPMAGTSLFPLSMRKEWTDHAVHLDKAWQTLEKRQLRPLDSWMAAHFNDARASTDPLLYMFSGPDFLYAHTFFPNASTSVLCGIEPIGPVPDIASIPPPQLDSALAGLDKALSSLLEFSFFITKEMKADLQSTRLTGTLPVLYTFLARTGCRLDEVKLVTIAPDGTLTEGTGPTPGVRIKFTQNGRAQQQTLYYFCTDLSDGAVGKSGFLPWLRALGPARSFAKAASYLMHGDGFTKVRKLLLDRSTFMIEDDSGIPARFFEPAQWNVVTYGRYLQPLPIFINQHPAQPLLEEMFSKNGHDPLPFSFGYRWHPSESGLIAARRLTAVAP